MASEKDVTYECKFQTDISIKKNLNSALSEKQCESTCAKRLLNRNKTAPQTILLFLAGS